MLYVVHPKRFAKYLDFSQRIIYFWQTTCAASANVSCPRFSTAGGFLGSVQFCRMICLAKKPSATRPEKITLASPQLEKVPSRHHYRTVLTDGQ